MRVMAYICRGFAVGLLLAQASCRGTDPQMPQAVACSDEGDWLIANQQLTCRQVMAGLEDLMRRRPECAGVFGDAAPVVFICHDDAGVK